MRDDFNIKIKEILARRVGMQCSNPNCRKLTCGPRDTPTKAVNIGVAAHITAASARGPRYDKTISSRERKSIENGIWLCQNCAKLIDSDMERYPIGVLREWKHLSEEAARLEVEGTVATKRSEGLSDVDLIKFYAQCFDRPAFQDPFRQEGSMEAFDKAIEDTIVALNTGCLRARDGAILSHSKGKVYLSNVEWRQKMDVIVDMLRAIRSRYKLAVKQSEIQVGGSDSRNSWYFIRDARVAHWMDQTRGELMGVFAEICQEAGVRVPTFPHRFLSRLETQPE
jgi:hypothetical protein